jgi:hypothetical protein
MIPVIAANMPMQKMMMTRTILTEKIILDETTQIGKANRAQSTRIPTAPCAHSVYDTTCGGTQLCVGSGGNQASPIFLHWRRRDKKKPTVCARVIAPVIQTNLTNSPTGLFPDWLVCHLNRCKIAQGSWIACLLSWLIRRRKAATASLTRPIVKRYKRAVVFNAWYERLVRIFTRDFE